MPWQVSWAKVLTILGTTVLIFGTGWTINGWRLEARVASLKASHAQALAKAQEAARSREKTLYEDFDKIRKNKDAKIKDIDARLAAALDSLRNRPDRLPQTPTSCAGTTGKELSRPDAEFLERFAADAQKLQSELNSCISQYNAARKALE
jgi:hypothetical protein